MLSDRKRRREAFFKQHPFCCFCGGQTPATTEDHQPGRVFFKDRCWPEGFVFPACERCNLASRESEQVLAVLIHGEGESDDRGKFQSLLRSVSGRHPTLVPSMLPRSTREIRTILKKGGIEPPAGLAFQDMPVIKLDKKFWNPHFDEFSRKLLLALHYQCFGTPLPPTGAIWHFVHTNFDYMAGRFPDEVLKLAERIATPARQKSLMHEQFAIRWNFVPGKRTGLFSCQFHRRLVISGVTTDTPEQFTTAWKQAPLRPIEY